MIRHCAVSLAVAGSLAVSFTFAPHVMAQTGAPGTKQMQDAQRKAEQKARGEKKKPHQNAQPQKAGSAASASAP
ncbi:hypothetical protein R69749_01407 [Paraburkholderia domus]|uniref:Uncharacterized protein n=1 Tax=Paraburkholderia domus TaxID=2793075 RepID=A0A9N8QV28_9BURK|nr:hypothetical protein R69749_01407 [Paraburkholderia domus]CAE6832538.1 hypothetical protein R75483_06771 [Paraburkholderia domus]CAE6869328.1 hypothetical protein R70211_01083 [Paraburkholderia domus]